MRIDWDRFPDDVTETETPVSREPLTPGEYDATIANVTIQPGWRVSDENPTGDCLSLWIDCEDQGERKRIFDSVPVTNVPRLSVIAKACGIAAPERGNPEWDESLLVGKTCRVKTGTYTVQRGPKTGEVRANVVRWLPAKDDTPKPRKRGPSAKPAFGSADDIPF